MIDLLEGDHGEQYVCDACDTLRFIDDTYKNDIALLKQKLANTYNNEVINYILCVLKCISNSLDGDIISIMSDKIHFFSKQIESQPPCTSFVLKKNSNDEFLLTIGYIVSYLRKQRHSIPTEANNLLYEIYNHNFGLLINFEIIMTLRLWSEIFKAFKKLRGVL